MNERPQGIHVRYVGKGTRAVPGVGVFQPGTVGFAPKEIAIALLRSGEFMTVADGPTAQALIVRVEQTDKPESGERIEAVEPAEFERELAEAEERYLSTQPKSEE